jgi:site-specific DNA recombinase
MRKIGVRSAIVMGSRYVALYTRVSTDDQVIEGNSLVEQREALTAYAASKGWHHTKVYEDDGYSAKNLDRPGIQRLISDIRNGLVEGVVTTRIDRLTRSNGDFTYLLELFEEHQCFYTTLRQNVEFDTASGKMSAQIYSVFAEFERNLIAERVYENLHSKAKRGQLPTKPPFGYQLVDGQLVPHPEEAKWVRTAADLLLSGMGSRQVAKYLNDHGVLSKNNKLWTDASIRALFKNEVITGRLVWNRLKRVGKGKKRVVRDPSEWIVFENHHEPLISREEFDAINELFSRRATMASRARNGSRLLSGIAKCGFCGGPMHAGWQIYKLKNGRHRHKTYRCGNYVMHGTCRINRVDADELDQFVLNHILSLEQTGDFEGVVVKRTSRFENELAECKRRIDQLDERIQRLFDALSFGVISHEDFLAQRARLEQQKSEEQSRLQQFEEIVEGDGADLIQLEFRRKVERLKANLEGDEAAQRAAILELIHEVKVFREDWRTEPEIEITYKL